MKRWKTVLLSRTLLYPVIATVILVAVSAWYYRVAVRRSETAVNERSLRALAAIADEFSSRLATLDNIGHQGWEAKKLRGQVPELMEEETKICNPSVVPPVAQGPAGRVAARRKLSVSGYKLLIAVGGIQDTPVQAPASCWSISFESLMRSLQDSLPKGIFEDLLLADHNGRILYQTQRSGMKVADLHPFFEGTVQKENKAGEKQEKTQPGVTKPVAQEPAGKDIDKDKELAGRLATSRLTDVELGGERYKLYTVPILVPVLMDDAAPVTFNFIVGGILHEHAFHAERVAPLLNTLVTFGFFVLLVAVGTYPVLRFRLMGQSEVLKQRTGFVFMLQIVFTAALVGGLSGHLMFSHYTDQTDKELKRLAGRIEDNLAAETADALDMLGSLETFYAEKHPEAAEANQKVAGKTCSDLDFDFKPESGYDFIAEVLKQEGVGHPEKYPYFDQVFFANPAGYQEIKFSARSSLTPEVRVCDLGAFSHALRASHALPARDLWQFRDQPARPGFWIEPKYSTTSGRYNAFISRPSDQLRKRAPVAVIGTELVSVSQPVFPPDYGFAVVDREGKVLFHSTPTKNGRENFADACGQNRQLRDLFELRENGVLETRYFGIQHRVWVQPMTKFDHCPWSIVVFRDLTNWDEDHFESVLMFLFLSGCYVILVIALAWLTGFTRRPPGWIWPAESDRQVYWRIFLVLILVNVCNFVLFIHCDGTQLWVTACTIPILGVVFTVWKLKSKDRAILWLAGAAWLITAAWTGWRQGASVPFWLAFTGLYAAFACLALPLRGPRWKIPHPSLATAYALPATVLLFTIGLLPALRLFNASVLFHNVAAARRSQLELADQLERRRERVSQAYFGIYGGEESARGKFYEQRLHLETKDLYYLDASVAKLTAAPASAHLQSNRMEPLLSSISSALLAREGLSPGHRSGLDRPDAPRVWCQAGPFPDTALLLRIDSPEAPCPDRKGELAGDYHNTWIASRLPQRVLPELETRANPLVLFETVLMFTMIIAAFFALRDAIRRLFALDWSPPVAWLDVEISPGLDLKAPPFGRRTVLLGVPRSGKTEALNHRAGVRYVDLIRDPHSATKNLPPGSDEVVVLDHFEHDFDNSLRRQQKLRLLERLVYEAGCRVLIVTTVDPLYYFDRLAKRKDRSGDESPDSIDIARWTKVLASFHVVQAKNRSSIQGEQYFALLWQSSSDEERVALHQIARHGWPNYLQEPALTHLFRRGLIVHDRDFAVTDKDFADYIRRSFNDKQLVIPELGGAVDTLSAVKFALGFAFVVFIAVLAYVWGDQLVAYVVTGASAAATVTRAIASSKGRGQMGGPSASG